MEKFYTHDFDWIENVPPSSNLLYQKIESILQKSEDCTANVTSLDKITGTYQVVLRGTLKANKPVIQ